MVAGGIALIGAAVRSFYTDRAERRRYAVDLATICHSEASSAKLDRNRYGVEEWTQAHLRTVRARTFFARLRRETPDVAAAELRGESARLGPCPAAEGYDALQQRMRQREAFDKMCREFDPRLLERAPRSARVGLLLGWSHEHLGGGGLDVDPVLEPLRGTPPDSAAAELRGRLADLDVHVCGMLPGLAAKTDPKLGPNAALRVASVNDVREPEVISAIRRRLPAIERCYSAELAKSPELSGTLNVKLRVSSKGTIDLALPQEDSTLRSAPVAGCAAAEIRSIAVDAGATLATGGASFDLFVVK